MGIFSDVFAPQVTLSHALGNDGSQVVRLDTGLAKMLEEIKTTYIGQVSNRDIRIRQEGPDIYERMPDMDAHLSSLVDSLTLDAASAPYQVLPGLPNSDVAKMHALFIEEVFSRMDFIGSMSEVYLAVPFGISLSEKVYGEPFNFKGKWKKGLARLERVPMQNIVMDILDRPKLRSQFGAEAYPAPMSKFVFMRSGSGYYGKPALRAVFTAWWYKQVSLEAVTQFIQRYGNPVLIARHTNQQQALDNIDNLERLVISKIASFPATDFPFETLEPKRDSNLEPYLRYFDDEMSKKFLSATRQSSGSEAAGAYSATEVHQENADKTKFNLAKRGAVIINNQIIKPLIDLNYGKQPYYPYVVPGRVKEETPSEYLDKLVRVRSANINVPISLQEFYEKSGFAPPSSESDILPFIQQTTFGGINFNDDLEFAEKEEDQLSRAIKLQKTLDKMIEGETKLFSALTSDDAKKLIDALKQAQSVDEAVKIIDAFDFNSAFADKIKQWVSDTYLLGTNSTGWQVSISFDDVPQVVKDWVNKRAFDAEKLANKRVRERMNDYLKSYINEGKTYSDFQNEIDEIFEKTGLGKYEPYHIETILRTEAQTAANYGRWTSNKAAVDIAPLWQYVYVDDDNHQEGTVCYWIAEKGGLIKPADWEGWKKFHPPNHFNCRSFVIAIPQEVIEAKGIKVSKSNSLPEPSDGFVETAWQW
jgi:hypothetical protein